MTDDARRRRIPIQRLTELHPEQRENAIAASVAATRKRKAERTIDFDEAILRLRQMLKDLEE